MGVHLELEEMRKREDEGVEEVDLKSRLGETAIESAGETALLVAL